MQRTHFDEMSCSVAQTINLIGEWWTPLILRDVFYGVRRFDAICKHLGISRKVLTQRLNRLVETDILMRVPYQHNPERFEYRLTERGRELFPVIVALMAWGDKWLAEEPPITLIDRETQQPVAPQLIDINSGKPIQYGSVVATLGSEKHTAAWERMQAAIAESRGEGEGVKDKW